METKFRTSEACDRWLYQNGWRATPGPINVGDEVALNYFGAGHGGWTAVEGTVSCWQGTALVVDTGQREIAMGPTAGWMKRTGLLLGHHVRWTLDDHVATGRFVCFDGDACEHYDGHRCALAEMANEAEPVGDLYVGDDDRELVSGPVILWFAGEDQPAWAYPA